MIHLRRRAIIIVPDNNSFIAAAHVLSLPISANSENLYFSRRRIKRVSAAHSSGNFLQRCCLRWLYCSASLCKVFYIMFCDFCVMAGL